ncbi:MAG: hypothetical protein DI621_18955 [Pseudomonas protegens]|nr:MAG: hypothetical protein DI621_18955 [Pseudomonas protegens]
MAPLSTRRSRLAGEEALKPCAALTGAFAGKPAPTGQLLQAIAIRPSSCRPHNRSRPCNPPSCWPAHRPGPARVRA